MEASKSKARPSQTRNNNGRNRLQDGSSPSSSCVEEMASRRSIESSSSSAESASSEASSSTLESMPPPQLPSALTTPPGSVIQDASAGAGNTGRSHFSDEIETRPSRSESTASRTNRLSLTLPIALPMSASNRPMPASSSVSSFAATPIDLTSDFACEPMDLITAIAAQERRVLELREELKHTEKDLAELQRQFASHENDKVHAVMRKADRMRLVSSRPRTAAAAGDWQSAAALWDEASLQNLRLDRSKAFLSGQQSGSQQGTAPSTPTQSRRRVFIGGHARTLSLLSPSKSHSDGFAVHDDQAADADQRTIKSPHFPTDPDTSFPQNLGRYAPTAANRLSKRASWAPQSVHQVAGAGLKQVAGDLTATVWTLFEDLRQATVGEELWGTSATMRVIDSNSRAADDIQGTIRASATGRPNLPNAFTTDSPGSPTPPPRSLSTAVKPTDKVPDPISKAAKAGSSSSNSSSKLKSSKNGLKEANGKDAKHFSWTPLTVDAYDDNDWSSWDSPTVNSPRWSGSTANGDLIASSIPEQAAENTTPQYVEAPGRGTSGTRLVEL
ncbi:hypothetical protein SEPCBS57363_001535 [Sporothrix epigloea]|uniref:DUF4048 domain-containing protein n=1 Tax=Sporothrix epigloea TaxID=1892477 RepID=A0ABP0DDD9_9PEZI